ncbi:Serine/threonine-protein kinase PknB [Rubripirellula tenax]|uniref:Serine/threonine-protein kinase PknB n=1 Tax=Rubripirellula tenax TaxID=2528015 RepID=A0A5C6FLE1_9BACT|nr:serine/threonine protein kinase [Rubripirellula tenax]TWU60614.1 Serine/threonine-protein kinase PknB [Rubripirellula tenax]
MDAARYAKIRDLFLAAEELPVESQRDFVASHSNGDQELIVEVLSLLAEHNAEFAKIEGDTAAPVVAPMSPAKLVETIQGTAAAERQSPHEGDTTHRGDSSGQTQPSAERKAGGGSAAITKHGAHRTHASPRVKQTESPKHASNSNAIWANRTRANRRRNSGWLWLAALLPTAMIGLWTYREVESMIQRSIRTELNGVINSVALRVDWFLGEKATLVQSWSREPTLRAAIVELNAIAETNPPIEELRKAVQIDRIHQQLQQISGVEDVKFVVWNDSYRTLASWSDDGADIGKPVHPSGAANLARVMSGATVIFGPERLKADIDGFVPETEKPVMAVIVPIQDDDGRIIASLLVRGLGLFEEFNMIFLEVIDSSQVDSYAINRDGTMLSESGHAVSNSTRGKLEIEPDQIAANLRVADPGFELTEHNRNSIQRQFRPVTVAVAGAVGLRPQVRTETYANYSGESVVGAWRWLDKWDMGVIVEQNADRAFAPVRVVRFSFLLLGSLLSLTAFLAATKIARSSTAEHAAHHPLSRYDIQEELGSGGMGMVFKAYHRQLGRDAALKVLRGDRHSQEDRLRFDREARLAASLSNPHSVQIHDYGRSDEGEAYCVMQFLRGLTLQEVVARSGHQAIGRMLSVMRQVCDALAEAHSLNLLHRDIKPQNIMLSLDPSVGDWAVVFDYGLAKPLEPDANVYQTSETIWAGTPMYMAPERFRQPGVMDPRSDIYSVGCVAYYLLSGRPPFIESDPESLFALILSEHPIGIAIHRGEEVPAEITELISKCMSKQPGDRFATIGEVCQDIDRLRVKYPWSVDEARVWWGHHGGE